MVLQRVQEQGFSAYLYKSEGHKSNPTAGRPPNSGGTSDRTHLGMCHALRSARLLMFMLVGETDGCRVLFLPLGGTEREPPKWGGLALQENMGPDTTGKMGLTLRLGRAVGAEIMRRTGLSKPPVWRWQERYVAARVKGCWLSNDPRDPGPHASGDVVHGVRLLWLRSRRQGGTEAEIC
jgi:hypothetical protein